MIVRSELEAMAETLERSGRYRVLRQLEPPQIGAHEGAAEDKVAVFVDVETTGLEPSKDEVIEIAIVKFRYSLDGEVTGIIDTFDQLIQPSFPIPEEATAITGITDEMVAGCHIDDEKVNQLIEDADLIIAHNAAFDRRFLERLLPSFIAKPWACSMSEIDWQSHGIESAKLAYLAVEYGFYYDRHRALNDCFAAIEILRLPLPKSGETGLSEMLNNARQISWRIWAEGAPFAIKDDLKSRGYRWNSGDNVQPRSWYIEVADPQKHSETEWLAQTLEKRPGDIRVDRVTALDRFSDRSR
jgi:DNA polymerase-3 subunit epsilon